MTGTVTVQLDPEVRRALGEAARKRGTTPETLVAELVREHVLTPEPDDSAPRRTLADRLARHIGVLDSGDDPDAARLSERTGEKFAALLAEKRLAR